MLAQEQGAQAVLATLWPVADESTKLLMKKFYQYHAAKPGTEKVAALRQAQLALLQGKPDAKTSFAHPYYWAPFILIGNWK